jgi:arylsulfatase B
MKTSVIALAAALAAFAPCVASDQDKPNVILVMTDDVGYGDLACHGNPFVKTPNLDKLYAQSVRLTDFHVSPKCSPTRASLLTGRHCRHVGVRNTNNTQQLLSTDVPTLADLFADNGYRAGIFGKWHLGEHFPFRPQDRGFQEVVIHGNGAVSTVGDVWGNDYFDDTYWHNGHKESYKGFCTDVWFDRAIDFMQQSAGKPFFVYLPTNAAHGPFIAPEEDAALYRNKPEKPAGFFGMITNFDTNMGRMMAFLEREGLSANTILIYTSDNGSALGWRFFNAGMQGGKMSPYDGGHRVPFFIRWPRGGLEGGKDIGQLSAHLDVLPTLVDLCGLKHGQMTLDGMSLAPQLMSGRPSVSRTLVESFLQVAMTERWRLVNGKRLHDIKADPGQTQDVADRHLEVVRHLQETLENNRKKNDDIQRRYIIGAKQNPVEFTPEDWIKRGISFWQSGIINGEQGFAPIVVEVARAGTYRFELRRWPEETGAPIRGALPTGGKRLDIVRASLRVQNFNQTIPVDEAMTAAAFEVDLQAGPADIAASFFTKDEQQTGAYFVTVRSIR